MNNSYITIIKEKRTALSRKRVPLNQNECTDDFRIGVPFEQNLHLIVFLLSMCLVGFIVYKTDTHEKWQRRTTAQLNVSTYGERIKNEITNGIAITDTLKQVLILSLIHI